MDARLYVSDMSIYLYVLDTVSTIFETGNNEAVQWIGESQAQTRAGAESIQLSRLFKYCFDGNKNP